MDVLEALKDVQRRRGTFSPFVPSDISIAPTVKEMDLIASTQGLYFLHMARQKTDKEVPQHDTLFLLLLAHLFPLSFFRNCVF
jgi:hypothetical protein